MVDAWTRHMVIIREFDLFIPKHHLMVHVNDRAPFHGNPWKYTTFLDESLNKDLKKCLRLCHQANFEAMAFTKVEAVMLRGVKRQRP